MPEQYTQLSLAWTNQPNAEPVASALKEGELVLNRADGILFYKTVGNDIGRFYSSTSFEQGLQESQVWIDLTQDFQNHIEDFNNPHQVTAAQVDAYTKAETDTEIDDAKNDLQLQIEDITQGWIGMVAPFASNNAPNGWLICNGGTIPTTGTFQGVNASLLQNLRSFLGSTYGAFGRLPDLRGEFIRGWDAGRGIDSGRTFGSSQDHQIAKHKHVMGWGEAWNTGLWGIFGTTPNSGYNGNFHPDSDNYLYYTNDGTNTTTAYSDQRSNLGTVNPSGLIGNEVRPRNVALLYCIKY